MADSAEAMGASLDFDPDALRERYNRERDRRIRPDGEDQYIQIAGKYANYGDQDPYAPKSFDRAPLTDEVEVAIIGGGWAGLLSAARLKEAGVSDIRIIEDGSDFGGTWYWNRYPGAQCDIESYCYLPLLEETGYIPKEKYSFSPEIFAHAQRIGNQFDLYKTAVFQTRVNELRWDEEIKRWIIHTNRGDAMKARFVLMATGPASRPKLPGIPGLDDFEGHTFHTSRWDYDYTGGDHGGKLDKLAGKRVAVIGTGATAIQCVPHLGASAEHLYVFQRTPSSVDLRRNAPTDPEWAKSLKPGWQAERRKNFNDVVTGRPFEVDLVNDGWTDIFRKLQFSVFAVGTADDEPGAKPAGAPSPEAAAARSEIADFQKMNEIRSRVDELVKNRQAAEALKPWYRQFCKRPTFNDDYLPTFNRPNVTLVDTSETHGVERITPTGVVAGGVEYPVDCIIFATGFEMSTSHKRRIGVEVYGQDGVSLYDHWGTGMRTLHGHSSRGFPNWFFIGLSQVGASFNFNAIVDDMARHVAYIITQVKARGAEAVQPTVEAEAAWVAEIRSLAGAGDSFLESCTPGYYNNEGGFKNKVATFQGDIYAPGSNVFNALLAEWRAQGQLEGLELS
jgi:cyclohexanone monooxygenase